MGNNITEVITAIGLVAVCGLAILFALPLIMGPSTDLTVNAQFDSNGNLSQYKITFKMPNEFSYNKFLQYANSQGNSTIREYFLRGISSDQIFEYEYDPRDLTITFWATQPFDPNTVTNTIHIIKRADTWRYEDSSFEREYFIPDSFINSITYKLNCPTEIRDTNADSRGQFLRANQLTWIIDRHKDVIGSSTVKVVIPTFYADVEIPKTSEGITVPGFGPIIALVGILVIALLKRK